MSAATALAMEKPRRIFQRHAISIPLDLIVLRSGVPENLPGRCTDISEAGVGAVVAGRLIPGQQVAVELRLPNVGVPVRARALVSYQSRLHCGLEFLGLTMQQREMIRYWAYHSASAPLDFAEFKKKQRLEAAPTEAPVRERESDAPPRRRIRLARRGFYVLLLCILALTGLGWWQWQNSWNEFERQLQMGESGLRVSPEVMAKRIVTKVNPSYPDAARLARTEGLVVLDAVISPDGSVKRLWPVSGSDVLARAATEAVQFWKFQPYLSGGKAVEVETTLAIEFRLH